MTVDAYQPRLQSVQFVCLHLQTLVFRDQPLRVRQQLHAVLGQAHGAGLRSILVGLSNKLDSELVGRKPVKRSHGQVVGTAIMDGKLLCKIVQ